MRLASRVNSPRGQPRLELAGRRGRRSRSTSPSGCGHETVGNAGAIHLDVLDHVAVGDRAADGQALATREVGAGRRWRGPPLPRSRAPALAIGFAGADLAAHGGVPQARVGRFVEGALLDPDLPAAAQPTRWTARSSCPAARTAARSIGASRRPSVDERRAARRASGPARLAQRAARRSPAAHRRAGPSIAPAVAVDADGKAARSRSHRQRPARSSRRARVRAQIRIERLAAPTRRHRRPCALARARHDERSSPPAALAHRRAPQQGEQGGFVDHGEAERVRLVELGSRLAAGDDDSRSSSTPTRHLAAERLDHVLGVLARQGRAACR